MSSTATYGSSILGYPRIGPHRELKRALESYWHGTSTKAELVAVGRDLQEETWSELAATGLTQVPGNTFSYYDHVLDNALLFGAVPERFAALESDLDPLDFYFTMCRGRPDFPPLELVRFFGTNYHYRQPELDENTTFSLRSDTLMDEFARAKARGIELRPVVLGPVSLLLLSKVGPTSRRHGFSTLDLLDKILPEYELLFEQLAKAGATCVQLDEPSFTEDRTPEELAALARAYEKLSHAPLRPRILVTGPYGHLGEALALLAATKVEALGLDLVSHRMSADDLAKIPGIRRKRIYAGVVDGRNVWRVDRYNTLTYLNTIKDVVPDLVVSTSTSLLHVPYDVLSEYDIQGDVADRLAFAKQKVGEVVSLAKALTEGPSEKWRKRPTSVHFKLKHAVRARVNAITPSDRVRVPYEERRVAQQERLNLPLVPATTLGSFPQTTEIRQARYELGEGRLEWDEYYKRIQAEIENTIRLQEDIGLDVLVHGEHERNDMIQYFAELLEGYAYTHNGWVQAYGSRCTRPPILYGDVSRPKPMTVEWISYAQSLTDKPVKGMLTGPVTMIARSFVRQDQPLYETADQLALVIRDEIADLEAAGIAIIQVDEPAIRELLPLREDGREAYLEWAVDAFRLATGGAKPETQIHTHLTYTSRASVVDAIERLDADVTAIVATRSITWVLDALKERALTHGVGPGVYESRSARIPDIDELDELLTEASESVSLERLWANPDGGLKTRHYWQLEPSLRNLVAAARRLRRRAEKEELED
ncbi:MULTISPECIES: 5-methyltetrahydropteroyltriglutamate--homocysteine S-methyltransferase [Rhodococcus]|jgi:5-methyltetrahydropteroyltriglutamate--homocysteine methyltransferase|uniref:5-methyltetrahydropteroyltriglutamate--homocysteine S-methyltransferase n=1 Tax=Rhodococcus oxybenzonivorans TaxID=1990687 RepID=A0AAE4V2S0_9NOCA|nr:MULTISPECIES: 5-methyltetrahydropteroyltriglutamate--homocysteine S-methyltransferase [Rhodococcus]MDV7240524.1 5-methyltetrahydropteroyltriglutamate--homocysteine S-methyltransferase [Rhodococcus oxybenzonivorans]MDV7266793.1 5-methyltetrahydropteroyltriglutamate--homocysteine S-methyltransferase [Rhodococcus oxybenzonivorans]MDV7272797.1 5-methyltetrahydropteroyltriglutamate--homocysteine S-methyltransferase [Rhodococcus oxybenzonivorans]MDV7333464.1 5-methyltetrahydropteroyltriglutamate--